MFLLVMWAGFGRAGCIAFFWTVPVLIEVRRVDAGLCRGAALLALAGGTAAAPHQHQHGHQHEQRGQRADDGVEEVCVHGGRCGGRLGAQQARPDQALALLGVQHAHLAEPPSLLVQRRLTGTLLRYEIPRGTFVFVPFQKNRSDRGIWSGPSLT